MSIHVAVDGKISFLFMTGQCSIIYVYVYMYIHAYTYTHHYTFIYLPVNEHLVCFPIMAIVNNAAVNIGISVKKTKKQTSEYKKEADSTEIARWGGQEGHNKGWGVRGIMTGYKTGYKDVLYNVGNIANIL